MSACLWHRIVHNTVELHKKRIQIIRFFKFEVGLGYDEYPMGFYTCYLIDEPVRIRRFILARLKLDFKFTIEKESLKTDS